MSRTINGFIADDLEETVTATGTGQGVVADAVTVSLVVAETVITVSVIYDTHQPTTILP